MTEQPNMPSIQELLVVLIIEIGVIGTIIIGVLCR